MPGSQKNAEKKRGSSFCAECTKGAGMYENKNNPQAGKGQNQLA